MRHYRPLIFFFFLIIIGVILNPFGLLQPVKGLVYSALSPMTSAANHTSHGATTFFSTLFSLDKILEDNQKLEKKNLQLQAENIRLKEAAYENNLLKDELGFQRASKMSLIPARIIAKSPSGFIDKFVLDKGSKDGVRVDQAVISHGFLVGRVQSVTSRQSVLALVTSSNSKIPALLQESRGTGLVNGGIEGLRMKDIQLDTTIKVGESVTTSGLGQVLPRGIAIGYVKEVISPQSDIAQSVSINSPVNFKSLEMVFIVK